MDDGKREEILRLYYDEHLSQKNIAYRLETTQQNISYTLKRISITKGIQQKGGVVSKDLKNFANRTTRLSLWRYHALHFMIYPYYFYPRYHQIREGRGNQYIINRDWKYKLHQDSIEIILRRGFDFLHKDKYESIALAENSLNRTLYELSNSCGFQFEKEGRISIKIVKQHLSRTNSALSKGTKKSTKKDYIQVKGIDGRVWFLIDKSQGTLEHEYIHSGRLMKDSETIEAFLNDLRLHPSLRFSELIEGQEFSNKAMLELAKQIGLHLEVLTDIKGAVKELREGIRGLRK